MSRNFTFFSTRADLLTLWQYAFPVLFVCVARTGIVWLAAPGPPRLVRSVLEGNPLLPPPRHTRRHGASLFPIVPRMPARRGAHRRPPGNVRLRRFGDSRPFRPIPSPVADGTHRPPRQAQKDRVGHCTRNQDFAGSYSATLLRVQVPRAAVRGARHLQGKRAVWYCWCVRW